MAGISIDLGYDFFYGQYTLPHNRSLIKQRKLDVVISQNSDYQSLLDLKIPYQGFHVIRDPRDVCVSSYFSFKNSHPVENWNQLKALRNKLQDISIEEGLLEVMCFNQGFFKSMDDWNYHDPNILELKYENVILDPEKHLLEACRFLFSCQNRSSMIFQAISTYNRILFRKRGLYRHFKIKNSTLPLEHVRHLNQKLSFKRLSKGRKRGQEDAHSHYRKGISGDWKNYITGPVKEHFKKQYGALLIKLGYEQDYSW